MKPACALARPVVLMAALEDRPLSPMVARHVEGCLRCQAESARSRTLRRGLQALATERHSPPRDLLAAFETRAAARPRSSHRLVPVLAAAAAISAVVVVSVRRRVATG